MSLETFVRFVACLIGIMKNWLYLTKDTLNGNRFSTITSSSGTTCKTSDGSWRGAAGGNVWCWSPEESQVVLRWSSGGVEHMSTLTLEVRFICQEMTECDVKQRSHHDHRGGASAALRDSGQELWTSPPSTVSLWETLRGHPARVRSKGRRWDVRRSSAGGPGELEKVEDQKMWGRSEEDVRNYLFRTVHLHRADRSRVSVDTQTDHQV